MTWNTTGSLRGPKGDKGDVGDPGPAGSDGLDAPNRVPADVAPRSIGAFDRALSIYTPDDASLAKARAALARVRAGVTGARCKIAWIGHSEVAGVGAIPGKTNSPTLLRKRLAAEGYPVGTGLVTAFNNTTIDSRWVFDANWVYANATWGTGNIAMHRRATVAGAVATFTSDVAGTIVDVHVFTNSAPFTVSIDGGAATTCTPTVPATGNTGTVFTFTGLPKTNHKVVITTTNASAVYLLAAAVRNDVDVEVSALGWSGAEALDFAPASWFHPYAVTSLVAPDLVLVELDANEALRGRGGATLHGYLMTIVSGLREQGFDVAIVHSPSPNVDAATWAEYRRAMYDVADEQRVPLVDMTAVFGARELAQANGVMNDATHPNAAGYSIVADHVAGLLGAATWRAVGTPLLATDWTTLALGTGFSAATFGHTPSWFDDGASIVLRGVAQKTTNLASNDVIATLPPYIATAIPAVTYTLQQGTGTSVVPVQVNQNGTIIVKTTPTVASTWASLDGLRIWKTPPA